MAEREVGDNLNRDTNLRKERHQGPSGSLNLSDYKLHEHAEETETHNEDAADNVIPVRRWIRGHYTKLTNFNEALKYFTFPFDSNTSGQINRRREERSEIPLGLGLFYFKRRYKGNMQYMIFGPSPDSAINNEGSLQNDANRDISLKKEKHLEDPSNSSNLSNYKLQECTEEIGTLNEHLHILHFHLRAIHPDKLTEEEKKEVKFHWAWDYFTLKDDVRATCNICKKIIKCKDVSQLRQHLSHIHKIFGPSPDSAINNESSLQSDANRDISLKKEKLQEGPSNSSNLSNYPLQECTEETGTLNETSLQYSDSVIINESCSDSDMDENNRAFEDIWLGFQSARNVLFLVPPLSTESSFATVIKFLNTIGLRKQKLM
ncbi:hypothetical protein G5I_13855 [Acromyrmex echinatior]|uniref:BED-type domain-containing protein n=1 Tax=Acromyrmex echinatior TaxID=103372 RepID=F4X652_ACREC|nr:hypothetical protein G5I_13855 [Acromyrmex echinatior]